MLADAFGFLRGSDDLLPTVVLGAVLSALSVFVLPLLIVWGYWLRVLRNAANDEAVPSFTRWGELLRDGLRVLAVGLGYAILLALFALVPVLVAGFVLYLLGVDPEVARWFGRIWSVLSSLPFVYVLPAALTNLAVGDGVRSGFALGTILRAAFTGEYATGWALSLGVGLIGGIFGVALSIAVLGVFVLFAVQLLATYPVARGFAKGGGRTPTAPPGGPGVL